MDLDLMVAAVSIILIDLVLSGDNAVVIGMAAHRLPARQRRTAILFGAGAAIVLRVGLTAVATLLLQLDWVRLVGGGLLLWIGFKLLKEEEEVHEGTDGSGTFLEAFLFNEYPPLWWRTRIPEGQPGEQLVHRAVDEVTAKRDEPGPYLRAAQYHTWDPRQCG